MKKLKQIFDKAYNMATWKHYVIWFLFAAILFGTAMTMIVYNNVILRNTIIASIIVGLIFSYIPTYSIWLSKYSSHFYTSIREYERKIKYETFNGEQLLILREQILAFHKQKYHDSEAIIRLISMIDVRLKYEFNFVL